MKWTPLLVLAMWPCWAGTLRGVVTNDKGHHVASAEVTIFNELAPIFVQVGKTDTNGNYHFKVGAGLYRVIVVKKDYFPLRERVTMEGHKTVKNMVHQLVDLKDIDENHYAKILKLIYRQSNREPYKMEALGLAMNTSMSRPQPDGLIASLTTQSMSTLNGEVGRRNTVSLGTRLGEGMAIGSKFSRQNASLSPYETQFIQADFAMDWRRLNMELVAEDIRALDTQETNRSQRLSLDSRYGQNIRAETTFDLKQSDQFEHRQQALALSQHLNYRIGFLPIEQDLELNDWRENQTSIAQKVDFRTQTQIGPTGRWRMAGAFQGLRFNQQTIQQSKWQLTRKQTFSNAPISIQNQVGMMHHQGSTSLLQDHTFQVAGDQFEMVASYREDQSLSALTSQDVLGEHHLQPATPYMLESFYRNRKQAVGLQFGWFHSYDWRSEFVWQHLQDDATLLRSQGTLNFRPEAEHEADTFSYRLRANQWGSLLEISHGKHHSQMSDYRQIMVSYSQWVWPFSDKSGGLLFELQMGNQPNLPAWWLLEEMPWSPEKSGNWYEGQVRLQF